jgi:hypothetical protein
MHKIPVELLSFEIIIGCWGVDDVFYAVQKGLLGAPWGIEL